jgi:hypothetical protein
MLQDELNWLKDVLPPDGATEAVQKPFLELFDEHGATLRRHFALAGIDKWTAQAAGSSASNAMPFAVTKHQRGRRHTDDRLGYIHISKVNPQLIDSVIDSGLGVLAEGRGGRWLGIHPELASAYMCALIEQVAIRERLHPVTDQDLPHAALSGWSVERLVEVLLGEPLGNGGQTQPGDVLDWYVHLAFETVVPANLATVPIDKIIEVRQKFDAELDEFRAHVTKHVEQLADLTTVSDLGVFLDYIRNDVERSVSRKLEELRERLRSVGLESVRALANVKSLALPPVIATAAQSAGLSPLATGSAVLAASMMSAPAKFRKKRRQAISESPVGYLFRVDRELNAATLAERVSRSLRRR